MEFLVEGNDVLSKDQLLKVRAGQVDECEFAGCISHCSLKIIVCIIVCSMDGSVVN